MRSVRTIRTQSMNGPLRNCTLWLEIRALILKMIRLYNLRAKRWRRFHIISCIWIVILILFNFDMSFYLLAVLSSIVDLFVQAILETMLSSRDTETDKCWTRYLRKKKKRENQTMGKTGGRQVGGCFFFFFSRYVKMFLPRERAAKTSHLRRVHASSYWASQMMWREKRRFSSSVGRAVSLRIQNTRSHIPLCLQFLYTTEGNKGTTVIWLQYHGAPRWWETSSPVWHCNFRQHGALLTCCWKNKQEKKTLTFLHLTIDEKKILFCAVLLTSAEWQTCRLQTRAYPPFSAFYSFYTVCTGAHLLIFQPCYTQARSPGPAQTEREASHMGNDVFSVIQRKKKKEKKHEKKNTRSTSVKLFCFSSSFILTNDITVQLFKVWSLAGGEGGFDRAG